MTTPTRSLHARACGSAVAIGMATIIAINVTADGRRADWFKASSRAPRGQQAAGPVGGVLGGAIGGVVGVVTGVTGVITGKNGQASAGAGQTPAANERTSPPQGQG